MSSARLWSCKSATLSRSATMLIGGMIGQTLPSADYIEGCASFASLAIGSHWKGSVSIGFQIDPGARATVTEGSLIPPCPISTGI